MHVQDNEAKLCHSHRPILNAPHGVKNCVPHRRQLSRIPCWWSQLPKIPACASRHDTQVWDVVHYQEKTCEDSKGTSHPFMCPAHRGRKRRTDHVHRDAKHASRTKATFINSWQATAASKHDLDVGKHVIEDNMFGRCGHGVFPSVPCTWIGVWSSSESGLLISSFGGRENTVHVLQGGQCPRRSHLLDTAEVK